MKPRMVALRLYLCLSGALSGLHLYLNPHIFTEADAGMRVLAALAFVTTCAIGALDTLINDVFSDRWRLEWAEGWRHHGYIVLAVANLAVIFVAISRGTESTHLARFALDAFMAVYVALRDVQIRFVEPRSRESYTHVDHHA